MYTWKFATVLLFGEKNIVTLQTDERRDASIINLEMIPPKLSVWEYLGISIFISTECFFKNNSAKWEKNKY